MEDGYKKLLLRLAADAEIAEDRDTVQKIYDGGDDALRCGVTTAMRKLAHTNQYADFGKALLKHKENALGNQDATFAVIKTEGRKMQDFMCEK